MYDDDRFAHCCQPLDDADAELRIVALIKALRPYLLSSPLPPGAPAPIWIPRQRRAEANAEQRIRNIQAMSGITNNRGGRA